MMPSDKDVQCAVTISPVSESALLLTWPEKIDEKQHAVIIDTQTLVKSTFSSLVVESIVSYNSLIIYYDYQAISANAFEKKIRILIEDNAVTNYAVTGSTPVCTTPVYPTPIHQNSAEHIVRIPVYYGKLPSTSHDDAHNDIKDVADRTGLTFEEIIALHTSTVFRAYALGFTPGFCYLGSLPPVLQLPRKSTPRLNVPKGAVAIAEQQTAVYPNNSPGGWHIIGRTPTSMYQTGQSQTIEGEVRSFTPKINVGQHVKFFAIGLDEYLRLNEEDQQLNDHALQDNTCTKVLTQTQAALVIDKMKGHASFQDLGRLPNQHLGFSASGASDEFAYLSANQLLGNKLTAPIVEILLGQIHFTALSSFDIALTGADAQATINNKPIKHWQCHTLAKGDSLKVNQVSAGLLTYLAICGGFYSLPWLGSCSQNTNEAALGFGDKPIKLSEHLNVQLPLPSKKVTSSNVEHTGVVAQRPTFKWQNFYPKNDVLTLRFIPSTLFLTLEVPVQQQFLKQQFRVGGQSNKMGYRLSPLNNGEKYAFSLNSAMLAGELSKPVCFGTIQIPPSGEPIVLMKDRQTIGGYPTLGTVIQTDLFRLSQKRPGELIQFSMASVDFAQQQLSAFHQRFS